MPAKAGIQEKSPGIGISIHIHPTLKLDASLRWHDNLVKIYIMDTFILCADDYGYSPEVSDGILQLIKAQRLSAVSCMTSMENWNSAASELKNFQNNIDIGLHLNLTEGPTTLRSSLNKLIITSHLRLVNYNAIVKLLEQQINLFVAAIGRLPDFIDGHQHVHHLPIVRQALIDIYQKYFPEHQAYIRISSNGFAEDLKNSFKASIIGLTGAKALKKLLLQNQIPFNSSFSGSYDFSTDKPYRERFIEFLKQTKTGGLIMCHPSLKTNNRQDAIAAARAQEYAYFISDEFLLDCQQANKQLARGSYLFHRHGFR